MKNKNYKVQVLTENYNNYIENVDSNITLHEYVEREAESDPDFFRWLFDDSYLDDFDLGLSDEQREEYREFIEEL